MSEVVPEIVEEFRPQFAACLALNDFAKDNRPTGGASGDPARKLVLLTYARSSRIFQASLLLALRGYGGEAGMLNRALLEDMLVAHWILQNPIEAPEKYERHRRHASR